MAKPGIGWMSNRLLLHATRSRSLPSIAPRSVRNRKALLQQRSELLFA
jgi:hypothetical protein